jgi:hypothetical protein
MYYPGEKSILEGGDVDDVFRNGDVLTLPDGRQGIPVVLAVNPDRNKAYDTGEFPSSLHLTTGAGYRTHTISMLPADDAGDDGEEDEEKEPPFDAPAEADAGDAGAEPADSAPETEDTAEA